MTPGLAKTLFLETYQRAPWIQKPFKTSPWPLFDAFFAQKKISYLDYTLTCYLLKSFPQAKQEVAFFVCHAVMAAQEGHLCICCDGEEIFPNPKHVWQKKGEDIDTFSQNELALLRDLIVKGFRNLPSQVMTIVRDEESANNRFPTTPFCRYHNLVYLQRYWAFESLFLKHFKRHCDSQPFIEIDHKKVADTVQTLCQQGILLKEQAQAIIQGCLSSICLISGGPGTGKTYTAGHLIRIFWNHLSSIQRKDCEIALAAPTGKAAANLQGSLNKVIADIEDFPSLTAKTLHTLLGIKQSQFSFQDSCTRLTADLIIVDESSMVDIKLMARLFEAVKPGARLIFLGDQHQLPSVDAGSIFADLIHLHQQKDMGFSIPCVQLNVCLRAELKSIINFAETVNKGEADKTLSILNSNTSPGIRRLILPQDKKEAQEAFLDYMQSHFVSLIKKEEPNQLLHAFNTVRILSPIRKGLFGVDSLNQLLWERLSRKTSRGWLAIPIMVTTNDYQQGLFNGETGVLIRKLPLSQQGRMTHDYALFATKEGNKEGVRKVSAFLLPKYEYAYCLSVHKSQGSEFDHVVLVMPEGSELFGKEVFYTAVTRARKQLEIYGSDATIHKTISLQGKRLSGIERRLKENQPSDMLQTTFLS